jgi:anaerobic ribonucleoside-triphosphate reductase
MNDKKEIYQCHDCKKELEIKDGEIVDGLFLVYEDEKSNGVKVKINITKCSDCFKKNPALTNFRECEVYSRVVGYLRPVQQWNKGKQAEFMDRKVYKE